MEHSRKKTKEILKIKMKNNMQNFKSYEENKRTEMVNLKLDEQRNVDKKSMRIRE